MSARRRAGVSAKLYATKPDGPGDPQLANDSAFMRLLYRRRRRKSCSNYCWKSCPLFHKIDFYTCSSSGKEWKLVNGVYKNQFMWKSGKC